MIKSLNISQTPRTFYIPQNSGRLWELLAQRDYLHAWSYDSWGRLFNTKHYQKTRVAIEKTKEHIDWFIRKSIPNITGYHIINDFRYKTEAMHKRGSYRLVFSVGEKNA